MFIETIANPTSQHGDGRLMIWVYFTATGPAVIESTMNSTGQRTPESNVRPVRTKILKTKGPGLDQTSS